MLLPVFVLLSTVTGALESPGSAEVCGRCHRAIHESWKSSAHAQAMESRLFQDVLEMAEADLDVVIRSIAKKQIKVLTDAAKKRHGRLIAMAAKAKDKDTKARHKHLAKATLSSAAAAARRLQITAENAADSYARSIKKAIDDLPVSKPAKKKTD